MSARVRILSLTVILTGWLASGCSDDDEPTRSENPPVDLEPVVLIAADRTGNLYTVDQSDGTETLLLDTSAATGRGDDIGVVSALLHVPETDMLWAGMGGNSICPGCIMTIDVTTGVATELADNSAETRGIPDLARRSSDGTIFVGEGDGGRFYRADAVSGVLTLLGDGIADHAGRGLTFAADGTLYMSGSEHLFEVDPDVPEDEDLGEFTLSGLPDFASGYSIGSMATRPEDGVLFGILKDDGGSGGSGPTYLVRVDPGTVSLTGVGKHGVKLDGLAFVPEDLFD